MRIAHRTLGRSSASPLIFAPCLLACLRNYFTPLLHLLSFLCAGTGRCAPALVSGPQSLTKIQTAVSEIGPLTGARTYEPKLNKACVSSSNLGMASRRRNVVNT
jgi:hypothetical protein